MYVVVGACFSAFDVVRHSSDSVVVRVEVGEWDWGGVWVG